ncbi:phage tail protein [Fructilactobacillus hinvesii]|uniref:Phage tail protein n=1 Tax=Fructilactobacillus hinvesii TaxID=2940300 RepID=A0ABY5BQT7_9LACO|nr:phage tail protein [Fructilactobacillus hinvesii]USS87457.1 phage tail protein [Fructilactobacillus hinvesii]
MDDLLVKGKLNDQTFETKLSCVLRNSFYLQWELNGTYQLQLVALDDQQMDYELLEPEASLFFQGQEYLIKQVQSDYSNGLNTKTVNATHVSKECQWFRQRETRNGVITYSPADVLGFVFNGNVAGFSFEVLSSFPTKQIENFGNVSGQEALNKLIEVWPDAVIVPDNRHIKVYSRNDFEINRGHRIDYQANASDIKITYDSTSLSNQVWCIGKAKDKAEGAPDNAPIEYFFDPFLVTIPDSINKYGIHEIATISDERFTNPESMRNYAKSQLQPEPSFTIEITNDYQFQPFQGDLVRLEIRPAKFITNLATVGFQYYPPGFNDPGQPTQLTLNSTPKTILDYQNYTNGRINSKSHQ